MLKMLFLLFMTVGFATNLQASAPMVKTQAPGFYRFMLGDFEVTAISDGTVVLPMHTLMLNIKKEKLEKDLKNAFLSGPFETSVNAYLINTGSKLVLIDAGAAGLFGPTLGKLIINITASGYSPEQIDEVYVTHLHNDHIGGILRDGKRAFPNAIVRADQNDVDFWLKKENMDKAPEGMKPFFQGPMDAFAPYVKDNKLQPFKGSTELIPGIKAVETNGHTPGHTVYLVESKGQKLLLIGDLIHLASVQFPNPTVTIQYDSDPKKAMGQRLKTFTEAAKGEYIIGATHISFPGLGHIRQEGKKYIWFPLNYTSL